jgi:DNA adenine methylase
MSMQVRSPLKTVGGKFSSAERIVAAFPPASCYDCYVEPFGGAAHVLFAKPASTHVEIYNDLSNNLYTFWQQVQLNAEVMQQRLDDLLYSRALYYEFHKSLFDGTALEPLERAIRFFYVLRSTGTGWIRQSPVGWNHHKACQAFRSATELFLAAKERMRYVSIDNRDCLATIKRYDSPRTLFFCDPPYWGAEHYYEASRSGFDHEGLASLLNRAQGYIALSYYPHPEINKLYLESRWRRMTWTQKKSSDLRAHEDGSLRTGQATELLLMNYGPQVGGLFDEAGHQ